MADKERADALLVRLGLAKSREEAKRLIMAGLVMSGTEFLSKPGEKVRTDAALAVRAPEHGYVGRGGVKLERALDVFNLSVAGLAVADIGASTGGFTDCLLQRGARLVYSIDVGYGQLAWSLRQDPRVRVMERTNFRHVDAGRFDPRPFAAVVDVSFISLSKLWDKMMEILDPRGFIVALIKPQFEAGPTRVGKGGIVRDPTVHVAVLREVVADAKKRGVVPRQLTFSPIRGGDGNIEFLAAFDRGPEPETEIDIEAVVREAHGSAK